MSFPGNLGHATDQPSTLEGWVRRLCAAPIPVLASTALELQGLRASEEARGDVDARSIAEAVAGDPLMTLKVLSHVSTHRPKTLVTDADTVTSAVLVMGINAFFDAFSQLDTVEEWLASEPEALDGVRAVLRRAHRASRFALGFAVHRMDGAADVVHEAALLHDFPEMLLWCHAPDRALAIAAVQRDQPTLRSSVAQQGAIGATLADIEQGLMKAWRLPERLIRMTDDRRRGEALAHPHSRMVELAVRLARHTVRGWDDPALPDDISDVAELLTLSEGAALRLVQALDDEH